MPLQVVTVAKFQGGGAFNVIPDSVTIGGTFRAFSKESFMQLRYRIEEVWKLKDALQYMWQNLCFTYFRIDNEILVTNILPRSRKSAFSFMHISQLKMIFQWLLPIQSPFLSP